VAATDTVRAATAARTREKRIVREDAIWDLIDLTVLRKTPGFYALNIVHRGAHHPEVSNGKWITVCKYNASKLPPNVYYTGGVSVPSTSTLLCCAKRFCNFVFYEKAATMPSTAIGTPGKSAGHTFWQENVTLLLQLVTFRHIKPCEKA
jgi:hypothetical protein